VGVVVTYNDEETTVSAEHLMAMMLVKAKDISLKANANVPIADAVLAVPHWFTDSQRRGVVAAAEIARLPLIKLANEGTLVALSYGIYKSAKNLFSATDPVHIMFVDIGYTGYTVSVVEFIQENLKILSTVCDKDFGGRDIDDAIIEFCCESFQKKTGIDVRTNIKAVLKLQAAAEKAKKTLSPAGVNEANINVECLAEDQDLNVLLTRDEFEARIAHLVARLADPIDLALKEAGLRAQDISEVEVVGGSSRVNILKRKLGEVLGLDAAALNYGLKTTMNADEAVARGGALQSAIESVRIKVKPFTIVDRVYYSVEARYTDAGKSEVVALFQRGDDIAKKAKRVVMKDKTADFTLELHYSAGHLFPAGTSSLIGHFTVRVPAELGAKRNSDGQPADIRVTFSMDKHGCTSVSSAQYMLEELVEVSKSDEPAEGKDAAPSESKEGGETKEEDKEKETKKKYKAVDLEVLSKYPVIGKYGIKEALEVEAAMAFEDQLIAETSDRRNELEAYIYAMRDKVDSSLSSYSSADEKTKFKALLAEAEDWLYGDGFDSTKAMYVRKIDELKAVGGPIEFRCNDAANRPQSVETLRKQLELSKAFASNYDDTHSHITEEDRATVRGATTKAEDWLYDLQAKQADLPLHATPVLTCEGISAKRNELFTVSNPIMTKPKPKPKPAPAPEPKPAEKKSEDESAKDVDSKEGEAPNGSAEAKQESEEKADEPMET
jgi:heat shock protein 4